MKKQIVNFVFVYEVILPPKMYDFFMSMSQVLVLVKLKIVFLCQKMEI